MSFKPDIFTSNIVVAGDFNPAIFSPAWLERNELIGEADLITALEGKAGTMPLTSHQVTNFQTDWFVLQVLENQFILASKGVLTPTLKDLAVGIFQLVLHTPVVAVGLNFSGQYNLERDQQHRVGDAFVPKDIWGKLYEKKYAGTDQLNIKIQDGSREDGTETKDEKNITLKRSTSFKYGIELSINDHHAVTLDENSDITPAEEVAEIIDNQWENMWREAEEVFDKLLSFALEEK